MSSPCGPRSTLEQRRSRRRDGHAENRTRAYQADRASLPQPGALTAASLSDSHQPRLCERGQIDLGYLTNLSPYQLSAGSRDLPIDRIIEHPSFRDSAESYFVQVANLVAFLLYQEIAPNGYMRKTGGQSYFGRFGPILLTQASSSDPRGIVRL